MNDEELKIVEKKELIKKSIENMEIGTLKDQSLKYFDLECKLNEHLSSLPKQVVISSLERFERKLKGYQKIEKDLSNSLILYGEKRLLSEKLDILKLTLAILYADDLGNEITEEKSSYDGIKDFIFKVLSFKKIQLKLKCFNLIIKLLEKTIEDSQFNKEYIGALDLLKLFFNGPEYLPNEKNLQYISNLGRATNEEDIRKCFYGVIRELNEKLLFQDLLKQLLKKIETQSNSPLVQFNIIFITKCLNDPEMDVGDLNQAISLVCHVLDHYNELTITKQPHEILRKIFNQNLIDLNEFKKDLKEKISPAIINNSVNQSSQEKISYFVADILQGFDFVIHFPIYINNEKIKTKLSEAKFDYNQTLEKKINKNHFEFKKLKGELVKINSKAKSLASDAKENLEEIAKTSADRLTNALKKKSETEYPEKNEKIDKKDVKTLLIHAKGKLLPIKEKLEIWNLILAPNIEKRYESSYSQITNNSPNLNRYLELIDWFRDSIAKEYNQLVSRIIIEIEKNRDAIMKKELWFLKSEINRPSLFHKIFHRGYFNSNLTFKKIKAYLSDDLSFAKVKSFILTQSFWNLLNYGIIRWPWMNKNIFAQTWAEQFYLPDLVHQIEKLKNTLTTNHDEEKLKEILDISKKCFFCQSEIVHILMDFKEYIATTLEQVHTLDCEINDHSNEKKDSLPFIQKSFFMRNKNCGVSSSDNKIGENDLRLTLKIY